MTLKQSFKGMVVNVLVHIECCEDVKSMAEIISLGMVTSPRKTGKRCAVRMMESIWMTDITQYLLQLKSGSTIHMPLSGSESLKGL